MIQKVAIQNYRTFQNFEILLHEGPNILVGNNESGKSTLIEAISIGLTGKMNGFSLKDSLSPYHFNKTASANFLEHLRQGDSVEPPEIIIELYLAAGLGNANLKGINNLSLADVPGIRIQVAPDPDMLSELNQYLKDPTDIHLIPTEYYKVSWLGFSGNPIAAREIPATVSLVDASNLKRFSGVDQHLQNVVGSNLDRNQRAEISRAYRTAREEFTGNAVIRDINKTLAISQDTISDRKLSLAIDISQRYSWENSLTTHVDEIPFDFVGKGEQNILKILLSLHLDEEKSDIVLVEEIESHLSFTNLNKLIYRILEKCKDRQVILTTHSSFVLNKLGMRNLILVNSDSVMPLTNLSEDTQEFFMKLSGYDTLRLVLAKKVILVEGPSDELIVQRAYRNQHEGRLPIEDGVDIISMQGLAFSRFLEIAAGIGRKVAVITDNDGKEIQDVLKKFSRFADQENIGIFIGEPSLGSTLEPQIVSVNELGTLMEILNRPSRTSQEILRYMRRNKTESAFRIFEHSQSIVMPRYIDDAIQF